MSAATAAPTHRSSPDAAAGARPASRAPFASALARAQRQAPRARVLAGGPALPGPAPGEGAAPASLVLPGERAAAPPVSPGVSALRAAVAALPPVVEAAQAAGDRPQLRLELGPALAVALESGPGGLSVALHPPPALQRAAEAEVPGLVAALQRRGLKVARVEVAPRNPGRGQGRAR